MNFNTHFDLKGQHAFLSASKYHWINYSEDKLLETYEKAQAIQRGIRLHELAAECIRLGVNLRNNNQTLNLYVNDAIGYKMTPEQILYYSNNCFGTADAISFKRNKLRIFDLKTGSNPASFNQLFIYAALFCLEYDIKPSDISMDLRIYQNDQIFVNEATVDDIFPIMDKIIIFDKAISKAQSQEV